MHRDGRHVLSHAAIYLIARGLPGIVAFLAIPLFSRLLDPAEYGKYALVVATTGLLNAMLFQWLRLALVRYMPAYRQDPQRLKSTLMTATLALAALAGLAGGVACLLPASEGWRAVIAGCWALLCVQALFELSSEHARAVLRPWRYMGLQLSRSVAFVAVGAGLALAGMGWWAPLTGIGAGMGVAVAWAWRGDWSAIRLALDRAVLARIAQYGLPLAATVSLTAVISSSDRFLIALFVNEGAAGLYSVAVDFTSQTLTLLMMAVYLAMFPIAVRAWEQEGPEAARQQMRWNASLLLALGVPCVVGLSILAPGVAHCFLGPSFRVAAVGILPLVAVGTFLAGFKACHFDTAFQFAHKTIYQVWIVLFAAAANIALNLVAIPRLGINGAAGASVIAYLLAIALTWRLGRRHFELPFPRVACAQVLLASGAMAAALWPMRHHLGGLALAGQIATGVAVYASALLGCDFMQIRQQIVLGWLRRRRQGTAAGIDAEETPISADLVEVR